MSIGNPDWLGSTSLATSRVAINQAAVTLTNLQENVNTAAIQGLGYELVISIQQTAAQTVNTPCRIRLDWTDQTTGLVTERQSWWVLAGSFGNPHTIIGHGPSAANELTLRIQNGGTGSPAVSVTASVLDVSRIYTRHDLRTDDNTSPAYPLAATPAADSDIVAGIVAELTTISIPAAQSVTRALPLYSGQIQVKQFSAVGVHMEIKTFAYGGGTSFNKTVAEVDSAANAAVYSQIWIPRIQCIIELDNQSATVADTPIVFVIVPLE